MTEKRVMLMKIAEVRTAVIKIPLIKPFKTALRTVTQVEDVLVRIVADTGEQGFGEAPPTAVITGETLGSLRSAIMECIAPSIVGMDITDIDGIMHCLHGSIRHNNSAKAAVDMAVYDLYAKSVCRPLYQILGGARSSIETDLTISVNEPEQMAEDASEAARRGFRILKVKVGTDSSKDIARIKAIRMAAGSDMRIRVDANQAWTPKEAVRIISGMEDAGLNIELVEQPVRAEDLAGMKYVTAHTATVILADESVFSPRDAVRIFEDGAADMVNIKLMKTGGLYEAQKICDIAEMYGKKCMAGCMLESKLAVSAAAHLAAGRSVITAVDLDGPSLCSEDPYDGGPVYSGPSIAMPTDYGIGITKVPVEFENESWKY